ncbi:NAD(P)-binding domain-containing protein [Streptomyces sp. ME02-8801-2C]|uniref:NAD(P)-dependent oxidoreductase n=1 Tax=Streptomyces sp. ME02-8801-2C TaxID=3028680 RepID=UPI0029BD0EC5|nr:NAD(P)-binding domain-containing protein [Streptomyces sp. ME02-8801-2C]MDX3455841.1 NAD(P)-binding domain-containing protein [Streptomyces sp. ME02-8801-2C]
MSRNNQSPVTVLGLGMMGAALATAFVRNGNRTTVWNRSANKADALVAQGAVAAPGVREAIAASPVIVACVSTYEVLNELFADAADELKGKVVVNLTSGNPEDARAAAGWAERHGVRYLDGAIMAVPQMIGLPQALIFYAGPQELFAEHEELLKPLAGTGVYLGEDTGVAMVYDLGLLSLLWSSLAGYFHAVALVQSAGVSAEAFTPFAAGWIEHVISPALTQSAREIDSDSFETEVSSLDANRAAIEHLVATSRQLGLDSGLSTSIRTLIERRVAQGFGNHSLASLVEAFKQG